MRPGNALGTSVVVTSPTDRVRKVRKVRKVFSLILWEKNKFGERPSWKLHCFQSPTGQNFPYFPCSAEDAQRAQLARTEPALAQAQASFVSASNGGKAATSRLTTFRGRCLARLSQPHEGDGGFYPTSPFGVFTARILTRSIFPVTSFEKGLKMPATIKSIKKGRGGARPGAGRKRRDIEDARERSRFQSPEQVLTYAGADSPLSYLLTVMRDETADWERRDHAARAALPYCHRRLAAMEIGKREAAQAEAETAGENSDWEADLTFTPSKAN
jgi:hypothetical protein